MSFFVDGADLYYLRENNRDVYKLDMQGWDHPGYAWLWAKLEGVAAALVRVRALHRKIGPPTLDFNASALTPAGLSKILRMLDDTGELHVKNVAPRTLDLLGLAGAFMMFHRRDVKHMVGESAATRIRSISELWLDRGDRADLVRFYQHKLLRHPVAVTIQRGERYIAR